MCNDCSKKDIKDQNGYFMSMSELVLDVTKRLQPDCGTALWDLPGLEQIAAMVRDKYSKSYNPSNKEIKALLLDLVVRGHLYSVQHGSRVVYQVGDPDLVRRRTAQKSDKELSGSAIRNEIIRQIYKVEDQPYCPDQWRLIGLIKSAFPAEDLSRTTIKSYIKELMDCCKIIECRTGKVIYYKLRDQANARAEIQKCQ